MQTAGDEIICWCSRVTRARICKAIKGGAQSLAEIRAVTGACTVGRCKELNPKGRCCSADIKDLLDARYQTTEGT